MPTEYSDDILGVEIGPDADRSNLRSRVYSIIYPPIGFFPFAGTGNGDYHGFYWPIGREELSPQVAYSSHDAFALIPEHGDMASAGRCQLARSGDHKLTYEFSAAFAAAREQLPRVGLTEVVAVDDHRTLLALDPKSPFRHCAVADQDVALDNLDSAEHHYREAIALLPEYGAAHFGLAYLLRRLRRPGDASLHLRMCLICPLAFWGGCFWADHILPGGFRKDWARKALMWLQQVKEPHETLVDDPFLKAADQLTLKPGVAESRDHDILSGLVDSYLAMERPLDAVYLWIVLGDLSALETTSYRERHGLTAASFGSRLAHLFRKAKLDRRAALLDDMLSKFEKANGLYL